MHKHKYINDLDRPVLVARTPTSLQPVAWERGEDGEHTAVFPVEYVYTKEQFEQYKAYPQLYRQKKHLQKHVSKGLAGLLPCDTDRGT